MIGYRARMRTSSSSGGRLGTATSRAWGVAGLVSWRAGGRPRAGRPFVPFGSAMLQALLCGRLGNAPDVRRAGQGLEQPPRALVARRDGREHLDQSSRDPEGVDAPVRLDGDHALVRHVNGLG